MDTNRTLLLVLLLEFSPLPQSTYQKLLFCLIFMSFYNLRILFSFKLNHTIFQNIYCSVTSVIKHTHFQGRPICLPLLYLASKYELQHIYKGKYTD